LAKQYPGFKANVEFTVGKLPNQILDLEKMVNDKRLGDNGLVDPLKQYLSVRARLLARAGGKSFKSQKAENSRESLYAYGNQIAAENAQFARIWQRLLSAEVED
jgi:hypothetical protein